MTFNLKNYKFNGNSVYFDNDMTVANRNKHNKSMQPRRAILDKYKAENLSVRLTFAQQQCGVLT